MVLIYGYGDPYFGQVAKVFDASGTPVTSEFQIDPEGHYGSVASDPDGNFVVVWHRDPTQDLLGQRFSPPGVPIGAEFAVNELPQYYRWDWPDVVTDQHGDFTVVWADNYGANFLDGPIATGVRGRRFAVCGNGRVGADDSCDDGN